MLLPRGWALAAGLLATNVVAKDPVLTMSKLDNLPSIFFYFDDSPVILTLDSHANVVLRSSDDAKSWKKVKEVPEGDAWDITEHPYDKKRAFIFGEEKEHWYTKDRGEKWHKFTAPWPLSFSQQPIIFHAKNPEWMLYSGRICDKDDFLGITCREVTYYTKDGFKSEMKPLQKDTHGCIFAHGTPIFKEAKDETILCIVKGSDAYPEHRKLLISSNWFKDFHEPKLDGYKTVDGLVGLAGIQKFIVAAVKARGTDEMALYVTDDTKTWHRAEFPHDHGGLREDAYTVLESTPYSIQVDVLTSKALNPMGSLFTSNSNGTYFTRNLDHTNRGRRGLVDFEQVQNIEGIVLANTVKNAAKVKANPVAKKELQSVISFHDGKFGTWTPLKGPDDKSLHLYSVTKLADGGRIYSSPAPGMLMGVGSLGDKLEEYKDCDLFISTNGGLSWEFGLTDAHRYEFGGSGSVIVAVNDEDLTDEISYSLNHGNDWKKQKLGETIRARLLTTTPDSTTLKFTLIGTTAEKEARVFAIDFTDVFDRKCKLEKDKEDGDFEKWYARKDEDGKPGCLMGHKQYWWRRKADAKCYVGDDYHDPESEEEPCTCTKQDFECDFNFVREHGSKDDDCVPAPGTKFAIPSGGCKRREDIYMGPSGYRKIPGNDCKGGEALDKKIERKCDEVFISPSNGAITNSKTSFKGKRVAEYFYLENSESSSKSDETIVMRTEEQEVWITKDHGHSWKQILKDVNVVSIYPNVYFWDVVYFITPDAEVWYTIDRGTNVKKMDSVKTKPNRQNLQVLDFHPSKRDWLIWTGQHDCESPETCHAVSYYTKDNGEDWHRLLAYVGACKWIRSEKQQHANAEKLIFCEHFQQEDGNGGGNVQLLASENFFDSADVKFDDIIGFATMAEFIIVASINEDGTSLKASASIDGSTFADAHFPPNLNVPHQTAYTVLDSDTHAIFLHVTVNPKKGFEYGSLLKSNSNGTHYVLSLDAVNRNEAGYVDFEKMKTLEGVAIANRVTNADKALDGEKKRLRSMITHDDGATWGHIKAPAKDSDGKDYGCDVDKLDKCSLNLHHYTERVDPRDTFASGSAVGLMLGIGNVGDVLTGYKDGNTFLTRDGGDTWKEVKKGQYQWEYGDQGSIIVLVENSALTDSVYYSLNEGETWDKYKFADNDEERMRVSDISTLPSDTSRKFLLWGSREGDGNQFWTVQLDFSPITDVECDLADDFELWEQPHTGGCLFGHRVKYNRKIINRRCFIGRVIKQPHVKLDDCPCERRDFECDFNYQPEKDATCTLVKGFEPPDHAAICKENKNEIKYWIPTGYRRLPQNTCKGGKELDKKTSAPCPGHEKEYEKEYEKEHGGAKGFALFLAIVGPIAAAFGIGWFVWTHILEGRFGAIRLGEDSSGQSPFVRYPIIVISAIVALAVSIPTILGAIGSWMSSKFTRTRRYTSRSSFARGADYSVVNTDEGELLGSDDEDEF